MDIIEQKTDGDLSTPKNCGKILSQKALHYYRHRNQYEKQVMQMQHKILLKEKGVIEIVHDNIKKYTFENPTSFPYGRPITHVKMPFRPDENRIFE